MKTVRVVLLIPFVKHPPGLVFELGEATGVSSYYDDDRMLERMSFLNKAVYRLPDGGNGLPYELSQSDTFPCPPEVFENQDLRSGPCRLTRAMYNREDAPNDVWDSRFRLLEDSRGFEFPLEILESRPVSAGLFDRLREQKIKDLPVTNSLDCSELPPGFYELRFELKGGVVYYIRFIKSFPLLVEFTGNGGAYQVQKTLY